MTTFYAIRTIIGALVFAIIIGLIVQNRAAIWKWFVEDVLLSDEMYELVTLAFCIIFLAIIAFAWWCLWDFSVWIYHFITTLSPAHLLK